MTIPRRFFAPPAGLPLAFVLALAGCAGQPPTSSTPQPSVAASDAAAEDPTARAAYTAAICPVFSDIIALDPRLAAMREAGAAGGDMSEHGDELTALSDDLNGILGDLEAVPEWSSGASLRFNLISGLHGIRAQLLRAADDPSSPTAAEALASIPFLANEAMDRAMQAATEDGLACGEDS